jgi:hypothetical protein
MKYVLIALATLVLASPALAGKHGSHKGDPGGVTDIAANEARLADMKRQAEAAGSQVTQGLLDAIHKRERWLEILHDHCGC